MNPELIKDYVFFCLFLLPVGFTRDYNNFRNEILNNKRREDVHHDMHVIGGSQFFFLLSNSLLKALNHSH